MILLVADPADASARRVAAHLDAQGAPVGWLHGGDPIVSLTLRPGRGGDWRLRTASGLDVSRDAVAAVWAHREGPTIRLPATVPDAERPVREAEWLNVRAQLLDLMVRSPHLGDLRPHPPADRLTQLEVARAAGLAVPATAVEMEPAAVTAFLAEHPNGVVTKAGARGVGGRTRRVLSATDLAPGRPHLLQAFVPKMADLRVFFLEGRCWTIALFPQSAEASVDHRVEGLAGSRAAPYRLPAGPAAAIADFMSAVGLNTGSLDLVLRPDGGHVFLEVNPSGQFSAVGRICGVDLEGEVARTLRRLAGRPEVEPGPLRLARPLERPLW